MADLEWTRADGAHPAAIEAIQPSLLAGPAVDLQAIGRTRQNRLFSTGPATAAELVAAAACSSCPTRIRASMRSCCADDRALLVYNPTQHGKDWWDGRGRLPCAI